MGDIPPEDPPEEIPVDPPIVGSILNDIKKKLGIESDVTAFDLDVITDINSVFMILNQIGVGPATCFSIEDKTAIWSDFLADITKLHAIKSYIFLKVRLIFDPPTSSTMLDALNRQITEFEWRLNAQAEEGLYPVIVPEVNYDDCL